MKLYISGPMRGYKLFNIHGFAKMAARLRAEGHEVFSPAEMDLAEGLDPTDSQDWSGLKESDPDWEKPADLGVQNVMRRDVQVLLRVDGVVMLDGWGNSKGATFEAAVAWYLGLPLYIAEYDGAKTKLRELNLREPRVVWGETSADPA